MGDVPLKIYLAGKISQDDWRHSLIPHLQHMKVMPSEPWPALGGMLFGHHYVGPFFYPCGHGCTNGPGSHGVSARSGQSCEGEVEKPHMMGAYRSEVAARCIEGISRADLVFAWIDSGDCYGTIWELGVAAGMFNVDVKVTVCDGVDVSELWLPLSHVSCDFDYHLLSYADAKTAFLETVGAFKPKIDYYEYIQSDVWRAIAKSAKDRAGWRCQVCNRSDQTLDAHHRTYERLGHESPEDITVLCRSCHELYEKNKRGLVTIT